MLVDGGGGGWTAVTGGTYQIKTMAVPAAGAGGMTASEVEALFSTLDPSAVAQAGQAHTQAAQTLKTIADNLVTHAQKLAGGWSGPAAQGSVAAMQQLHQTTIQLAQASAQTGQVLSWLGNTILPYYKNWKAPSNGIVGTVESWFGSNPQDTAAQQVMQRLNDRLSQANAALPPTVSFNPPKIGAADHAPATSSGTGPAVAAGPAVAGIGLTGGVSGVSPGGPGGGVTGVAPGAGVGPGGGQLPGGPGTNIPAPPPTSLAGVPPGPGTGPGPGTPPPTLPGGPGPSGGIPTGTGPGGPGPVGVGPMPGGEPPPPGTVPGEGEPPPVGTVPGEAPIPGEGPVPGDGPVPGEGPMPGGGMVPGGEPAPGSLGSEPGASVGPGGPGGDGLIGEEVPGEGAVMGSDGMIGTGPGMGTIGDGEFGPGNTGATGFVGADDAATSTGGGEYPGNGGTRNGRRENERYRQAWMAEDADIWEGESKVSPSLIGS
jgi:uncharacterized protein YukE